MSLEQYKDANRAELWNILQIQAQVLEEEIRKNAELEKGRDEEVEEIIKHRIEMQKAVENVSGCGDCVLIPMQIWESLTSVYYNHKSVSLKAHNLEQRIEAINDFSKSLIKDLLVFSCDEVDLFESNYIAGLRNQTKALEESE